MKSQQHAVGSQLHYLKKINSQLILGTAAHESVTAINNVENFTVWNKLETWKLHSIKTHNLQLHFCCNSSKTLFYSISWRLLKLGKLEWCDSWKTKFQNIFNSTQIWVKLFHFAHIWFRLVEFIQMFKIYPNINEPHLSYPDVSNSTQI